MGKKVLRGLFPVLAVAVIVYSAVRVISLPEDEKRISTRVGVHGISKEVRDGFARSVESVLDEKEAKLGLAYLVGMKDGLDKETQDLLKMVGLTHIVVASGTHLSIIVEFFKKRFGKISRFAGMFFSLIFILVFASLVGWTASITRAAIVSTLSVIGWYFGRKLSAWRVILFTMSLTLLINPLYIIDLGWQLSFASFTGIMILSPLLIQFFFGRRKPGEKNISWKKRAPGKISEIILASISANLMCIPILIYYFGYFSTLSILANLLILPTIPFAMGLTFLAGIVGFLPSFFVFDWIRLLVARVTTLLLDYHLIVVEFFSKQTSFILEIGKGDLRVFLLYAVFLLPFAILAIRNQQRRHKEMLKIHSNLEKYLPFTTQS